MAVLLCSHLLQIALLIVFFQKCSCWHTVHVRLCSPKRTGLVTLVPTATGRPKSTAWPFCATSDNGTYSKTQQKQQQQPLPFSPSRDEQIRHVLQLARQTGPVGVFASKADQERVHEAALALRPWSEPRPARVELTGVHNLVYSSASGPSSGRVGPWAGTVTQNFVDPTMYINAVELGPLRITLSASRQVIDDETIEVKFQETEVELFGNRILKSQASGGGIWKVIFVGTVTDEAGVAKFIRVMESPSLFVLEHQVSQN